MYHAVKRALLLASVAGACVAAQAAFAATEEKLSKPELLKLNECMAMTKEMLAQDSQCGTVMKKASITATDIEKMRKCEGKMNIDVTKDPDCAAMIKKHPDLVRGHGELEPSTNADQKAPAK
jgi:uncharacterized protein YicC (UPF0701 family)